MLYKQVKDYKSIKGGWADRADKSLISKGPYKNPNLEFFAEFAKKVCWEGFSTGGFESAILSALSAHPPFISFYLLNHFYHYSKM
jgi:hypothetical protein